MNSISKLSSLQAEIQIPMYYKTWKCPT